MKLVFWKDMDKDVEKNENYRQVLVFSEHPDSKQQRETGILFLSKSTFGRNLMTEF